MLKVENLTVTINGLTIVKDINFSVREGQWLMIVGPNGAGKSTIVNAVSQGLPYAGKVLFEGEDLKKFKPRQLAEKIGVLAQNHYVGYSFTVEDIVRLGRYSYSGFFSKRRDNEQQINDALELAGMLPLRNQSALTLSGGELQRMFLAQVIAQNPKLMLLDEPSNHLDLVYQKQMFELIRIWLRGSGKAVISVVHDLNLAKKFGTDAILLDKSLVSAYGSVDDVLTAENLNPVYGMDVGDWMRSLLTQWG